MLVIPCRKKIYTETKEAYFDHLLAYEGQQKQEAQKHRRRCEAAQLAHRFSQSPLAEMHTWLRGMWTLADV